eukprot:6209652-Prymnesium_polylepis.1
MRMRPAVAFGWCAKRDAAVIDETVLPPRASPAGFGRSVGSVKVVHSGLGVHVVRWVLRSPVSPLKQIPEDHSPFWRGI